MPSQALIKFYAAVDASNLGANAKDTAKEWGQRLYLEGIKEAGEHIRQHLRAEVGVRPPSAELTARREIIEAILDRTKNANDPLALSIADALEAGPARG